MMIGAITLDMEVGGFAPFEFQLASSAGLTPLCLPDSVRRFQDAMRDWETGSEERLTVVVNHEEHVGHVETHSTPSTFGRAVAPRPSIPEQVVPQQASPEQVEFGEQVTGNMERLTVVVNHEEHVGHVEIYREPSTLGLINHEEHVETGRVAKAEFARLQGVRLPEGEARVPKGMQAAEQPIPEQAEPDTPAVAGRRALPTPQQASPEQVEFGEQVTGNMERLTVVVNHEEHVGHVETYSEPSALGMVFAPQSPIPEQVVPEQTELEQAEFEEVESDTPAVAGRRTLPTPLPAANQSEEIEKKTVITALPNTAAPQVENISLTALREENDVEAASIRMSEVREVVNKVVEAIVEQISIADDIAIGKGEIKITLKPSILDGMEITLGANEGTLKVSFTPATQEAAQIIAANLQRLEAALEQHAGIFNRVIITVSNFKKGKTNEGA